jgi:hypothetical protein
MAVTCGFTELRHHAGHEPAGQRGCDVSEGGLKRSPIFSARPGTVAEYLTGGLCGSPFLGLASDLWRSGQGHSYAAAVESGSDGGGDGARPVLAAQPAASPTPPPVIRRWPGPSPGPRSWTATSRTGTAGGTRAAATPPCCTPRSPPSATAAASAPSTATCSRCAPAQTPPSPPGSARTWPPSPPG